MTRVETENPDCLQTRDWRRSMIFLCFCVFYTDPRHRSGSSGPDSRLRVQNGGTATRRPHAGYCPLCHRNKKKPEPQVSAFEHRESSVTVLPEPVAPISSIWVRASEFVTQSSFICSVRS